MARVAGVEIANDKKIWISLQEIYGVGEVKAREICKGAKIDEKTIVGEMSEDELDKIRAYIDKNLQTEGELRQKIFRDIKRLKDIRSYRGIRHKLGLPVKIGRAHV